MSESTVVIGKAYFAAMFPKQSCLPPYEFVKYEFGAGFGLHIPSGPSNALRGRLINLTRASSVSTVPPLQYARKQMAKYRIVKHTAMNMERADMYELDQFFMSMEMTLDPACYESLIATAEGGRHKRKFQQMPFQQFMTLDAISTMMNRSDLNEHRATILMHTKRILGLDSLGPSKCDALQRRLMSRVVGTSVRRRMGKSVAVYASLARTLAFYPRAGIRGLYTVHKLLAAEDCHSAVSCAVPSLVDLFNRRQVEEYTTRMRARGHDDDDFYYSAECFVLLKMRRVEVAFTKMTTNTKQLLPVRNTLTCKPYVTQNVSSFSFIT